MVSSEEYARSNLSRGLSPNELVTEEGEKDSRPGIVSIIGDFLEALGTLSQRALIFVKGYADLQISEVPESQVPKKEDPADYVTSFLGDKNNKGPMNATTPDDVTLPDGVDIKIGTFPLLGTKQGNQAESGFENAYLPEKCRVITTGECDPFSP